jgi:hypothetical protein
LNKPLSVTSSWSCFDPKFLKLEIKFGERGGRILLPSPAANMGKGREINFGNNADYHIFHLKQKRRTDI